jgi:hypothetical protein
VTAPASLTGISEIHRQQLVDRALLSQHGDALAELQTLERAIEAAESAVEMAHDEIRLAAFDQGLKEAGFVQGQNTPTS